MRWQQETTGRLEYQEQQERQGLEVTEQQRQHLAGLRGDNERMAAMLRQAEQENAAEERSMEVTREEVAVLGQQLHRVRKMPTELQEGMAVAEKVKPDRVEWLEG